MTPATLSLTDFLLARITEDESAAHGGPLSFVAPAGGSVDVGAIRRRVLAECEAKRRIVGDWQAALDRHIDESPPTDSEDFWGGGEWGVAYAVRALVSIYADHPDYREEWRV